MRKKKFHAFWDDDAVNALFPQIPIRVRKRELKAQIAPLKKQLIRELATHEPTSWRMPANMDVTNYAQAWANEILPISREAHERMQFRNVHPQQERNRVVAAGEADEKSQPDRLVTAHRRQMSSPKNCRRPGDALRTFWEKLCKVFPEMHSCCSSASGKMK